jgi:hypothetical protein
MRESSPSCDEFTQSAKFKLCGMWGFGPQGEGAIALRGRFRFRSRRYSRSGESLRASGGCVRGSGGIVRASADCVRVRGTSFSFRAEILSLRGRFLRVRVLLQGRYPNLRGKNIC